MPKGVEAGILGGPHDGTFIAVPLDDDGWPDPTLVIRGTDFVWGQDPRGPDEVYRLRVNPSDDGPLFLYVHPSVTTESGR